MIDPTASATVLANALFSSWLADDSRSAAARAVHEDEASLRRMLFFRLESVLRNDRPAFANRKWLFEALRAWAPLELLFPSQDFTDIPGVSGEMPRHAPLLVEREYGHVLAATRSLRLATLRLRADAQLLALQVEVAGELQPMLENDAGAAVHWLRVLQQASLAMSEYLHRHAIGLPQVLPDALVMTYTAYISNLKRELRESATTSATHVA
jgi:hypothetical protein